MAEKKLFTSESVTMGHPDKVCDQISDAILDAIIAQDKKCRVAVETLVKTGMAVVAGEVTTDCYVPIPKVVRETIKGIGYTHADTGFDYENLYRLYFERTAAWQKHWGLYSHNGVQDLVDEIEELRRKVESLEKKVKK